MAERIEPTNEVHVYRCSDHEVEVEFRTADLVVSKKLGLADACELGSEIILQAQRKPINRG